MELDGNIKRVAMTSNLKTAYFSMVVKGYTSMPGVLSVYFRDFLSYHACQKCCFNPLNYHFPRLI